MKHLRETVLTVSSVGVDDDEALGLKLLVGGWLVGDEAFLEVDLSRLEVEGLVVGVGVVEAWLLEKPWDLDENLAYLKSSCTWRSALVAWCTSSMRFEYGWKSTIFLMG